MGSFCVSGEKVVFPSCLLGQAHCGLKPQGFKPLWGKLLSVVSFRRSGQNAGEVSLEQHPQAKAVLGVLLAGLPWA